MKIIKEWLASMANVTNDNIDTSESIGTKRNWAFYCIVSLAIIFFAIIIEKNIELPKAILYAFSGLGFFYLLFAAFGKPEIVIYALVAYLPFSKILVGDYSGAMTAFNFTNILTVLAILAWITQTITANKNFYTRTSLDMPLFLFMFLGCLSLTKGMMFFGSAYASEFVFSLKRWLTPMFFFFIIFNMVRTKKEIKNIVIVIMVVMTTVALMAIKDYIDIGQVSRLERARVGGITAQPNILAAFFVYYMFLFAGFMLVYWRNFKYWLLFFPFLACFRGIQVTFSRGGYVAFAAAALAIAFFKNKILWVCLILVFILALLNPILLPKGIAYRLASTFDNEQVYAHSVDEIVDKSSQRRIEAWKGGMLMIKQKPLFGFGYGLFPYLIPHYAPVRSMDAHNTYILIAVEMGIPALLVFLLVLFIIFINTRRLYVTTKDPFMKALALGFLGTLGGVFVANIFGGRLDSQEMSSYFWILAALIFKALYLEREENKKKAKNVSKPKARLQKSI